jgi:alkanesulfonate monooxygenase SsuD/methylene tetrahydromethanopterin reductase-like flavin-dependent oxidoreductase (luciferase family)
MQFGVFLAAQNIRRDRSATELYGELLEQAVLAEELGFDCVWLPEHHFVHYISVPDLLQLTIAVADRTKTIRIGGAIFITAFHHPLLLAGSIGEADHLTRGRFEPGFGKGAVKHELRLLQMPLSEEERQERFVEFVDVIENVWARDAMTDFHGKYFDFTGAYVVPRPHSKPHPRFWIAATTPATSAWAGRRGFNLMFASFRNPFARIEEGYRAWEGAGGHRPGSHGRTMFMTNRITYVAPTMEETREFLPYLHEMHRISAAGQVDRERVVDGVRIPQVNLDMTDEELLNNLPIGDPATVAEKVAAYAQLGVDQLSLYASIGQPHRSVLRSLELFATHVMPHFRESGPR